MIKNICDLFVAFFKSSILSYGGGPASIPLMQSEVVSNYKWFSNEQFADALAIGNALPGPIAPKIAAYVGYHVAGVAGALSAVCATVVPTAVAMIALAGVLLKHRDSPHVGGMMRVAKPIVAVLLLTTAFQLMTKQNFPHMSSYIIAVVALVSILFIKIDPAIVVIVSLAMGFGFYQWF